jgi:hypothetical protein
LLLRNHSVNHEFSALKYFPLFSITVFGFLPILISENILRINSFKKHLDNVFSNKTQFILKVLFSLIQKKRIFLSTFIIFVGISLSHSFFKREFPVIGISNGEVAKYIRMNSVYEDVYYGLDGFEIPIYPPYQASVARKLVKKYLR